MPTVHMVCGAPGAGKTTYARALADAKRCLCLSVHEWMKVLFEMDAPQPPERAWTLERAARCEAQMWLVADSLLARGADVVFDVDLATVSHRDAFRSRIAHTRAETKMHYLDVGQETRRARVLATGVTQADFDLMDRRFEAPSDDELSGAMIVCDH